MMCVMAAAFAWAGHAILLARVDVDIQFDKTVDFKPLRTWAWNPKGPGDIMMARTATDDPEAARKFAEPIVVDAVRAELKERGLREATDTPDLVVTYYLLLSTSMSTQEMGQFLPSVAQWGLPPFTPQTTSFKVLNKGSLVIDLRVKQDVAWRGVANAHLKLDIDDKKRESVLRQAIHDIVRRYPPK
jgi:hypothetical protein